MKKKMKAVRMETTFDSVKAEKHLKMMLKQYRIKVRKWSVTASGRAYFTVNEVKIPKPTDIERFCVGMHEIKHCIDGHWGKLYQSEYACEMFAIEQAELLGFDITEYKERARRYVIMCISKGYCRKLNLTTLDEHIKDFCNIDFSLWTNKKVFVSGWGTHKGELTINYQ